MGVRQMDWVLNEPDSWRGWQTLLGPVLLLLAAGSSVLTNALWGRTIGNVSCGWQLGYSPKNEAFVIWVPIYFLTFITVLCQLLYQLDASRWSVASLEANALIAGAWACSSLWTYFFSLADSRNLNDGLGLAAVFLVLAAVCALAAVVVERSWQSAEWMQILTIGLPFSLFAGWLILAASLSVGVAIASDNRAPDKCGEDGGFLELREIEVWERAAPVIVVLCVGVLAIWLGDLVLLLPVIWGVFFMNNDVRTAPMVLAVVAFVTAAVRAGVGFVN